MLLLDAAFLMAGREPGPEEGGEEVNPCSEGKPDNVLRNAAEQQHGWCMDALMLLAHHCDCEMAPMAFVAHGTKRHGVHEPVLQRCMIGHAGSNQLPGFQSDLIQLAWPITHSFGLIITVSENGKDVG